MFLLFAINVYAVFIDSFYSIFRFSSAVLLSFFYRFFFFLLFLSDYFLGVKSLGVSHWHLFLVIDFFFFLFVFAGGECVFTRGDED